MIRDLERVADKIKDLLERYPECRDNDKLLWLGYNATYNGLKGLFSDESQYKRFKAFLLSADTPMFESLSRARRKVQETYPHLSGNREARMEEAKAVRAWSRPDGRNVAVSRPKFEGLESFFNPSQDPKPEDTTTTKPPEQQSFQLEPWL